MHRASSTPLAEYKSLSFWLFSHLSGIDFFFNAYGFKDQTVLFYDFFFVATSTETKSVFYRSVSARCQNRLADRGTDSILATWTEHQINHPE